MSKPEDVGIDIPTTQFEDTFSEEIWSSTYKDHNDDTLDETFYRVARYVASAEGSDDQQEIWTNRFYDMLSNFKCTAGGRIYANAGTEFNGTTMMNCFSGDTPILTNKGVFNAEDIPINSEIKVLTQNGYFEPAIWKEYGKQHLYDVTFSNGEVVTTTAGHEWVVTGNGSRDEKVKTENLLGRNVPLNGLKKYEYENLDEYKEGIKNGLVFGDGYVYTHFTLNKTFAALQQFGDSRHLIVDHFGYTNVTNYNGDNEGIHYVSGLDPSLKSLPSLENSMDYLRGFIAGVIAADGCIDTRGCVVMHTSDYDYAVTIRDISIRVGLPVISLKLERDGETNLHNKNSKLWKLTFVKKHFQDDPNLILKNSHKEKIANSPKSKSRTTIKCVSVDYSERFERVYCCDQPSTHTFTLGNGLLTCNCFVSPRGDNDIDSLSAIVKDIFNQAQTLKSEGGWGQNFSWLRPRGAFIHGIGVESPGSVKYMEIYDKVSDVITSGSGKKSTHKKAKGKIRKGAMMGVMDCISGNALVDTIEGKIPMKDLVGKRPYLYCTDGNGNVYVRQALKVWSKGVRETLRVGLDNGDFIECTPDHEFLLTTGEYKKAKDLEITDSLAALNKRLQGKYLHLGVSGSRKQVAEHNAVYEMKYGQYPECLTTDTRTGDMSIAHHIDHNTINNLPENIASMTVSEHSVHHSDILLEHQKRISEDRKGKTWEEYYGVEKAKEIREKYVTKRKDKTPWNKGKCGAEYKKHYENEFSNQFSENQNHKVLYVQSSIEQEVFDISMPAPYHNFSVNDIFVHNCWHPDIEEFIRAKQQAGRLTKFNISVNCTDEFMQKVLKVQKLQKEGPPECNRDDLGCDHDALIEAIDKWDLRFPDTTHDRYREEWDGDLAKWERKGYPVNVYKTISVTGLWELIMESTYNRAEPGVLFLDRANYFGPLSYLETIFATNPCFHGDTMIGVADGRGAVSISQLEQEGKDVPVYAFNKDTGEVSIKMARNPRITGYDKELVRITLDDDTHLDVTPNHKFYLMDGREVRADELVKGDSLPRFTRRQQNMNGYKKTSTPKKYWQVGKNVNDYNDRIFEHRLIAQFFNSKSWNSLYNTNQKHGWAQGGLVVHHKDYDGLNNRPENLEIMTWKEHQKFHASHDCSGENNGMYGRKHKKETLTLISESSKERWNDPKFVELQKRTQKEGYTNEVRQKISNDRKTKHLEYLKQCEKETDLNTFWVGDELFVEKICEGSGQEFSVPWNKREICFAPGVNAMESASVKELARVNMRKAKENNAKETRHKQVMIYKDLKEELNRDPYKKEWEQQCKTKSIPYRMCQKTDNPYIINTFKELKHVASEYNHRVKSVERIDGKHTVYNLTVDDVHTVSIITSQDSVFSGVFALNCGEQTLAPGGVCNLGSLNLTQFLLPDMSGFDLEKLKKYVRFLNRFLDNINSLSNAPLSEYMDSMRKKRRVGIGILGWGSALFMMKVRFASDRADEIREEVMSTIARESYMSSIDLAEEKGMFEYCIPEKHAEGHFIQSLNLSNDYMEKLNRFGIRNSSLLSIQPTGNTSSFANIVSGGLEPIFLPEYVRTVIVNNMPDEIADVCPKWFEGEWFETSMFKFDKEGDDDILKGEHNGIVYKIDKNRGLTKEVIVQDYRVRLLASRDEWNPDAEWAVTTADLTVDDHVRDLKGFARWVDSAMSKTVNVPQDYPFEDFKNIYLNSYKSGYVKGVTTYRSGTMSAVLSAKDEKDATDIDEEIIIDDIKVPAQAPAQFSTIRAEGKKWYLTTIMNESGSRPMAFFVHTNAHEKSVTTSDAVDCLLELARDKGIPEQWVKDTEGKISGDNNPTKIARCISLNLRHGVLIKNVVNALDDVKDVFVNTFLFQIKKYLSTWIKEGEKVDNGACPECNAVDSMVFSEGCIKCSQCGYSKCG